MSTPRMPMLMPDPAAVAAAREAFTRIPTPRDRRSDALKIVGHLGRNSVRAYCASEARVAACDVTEASLERRVALERGLTDHADRAEARAYRRLADHYAWRAATSLTPVLLGGDSPVPVPTDDTAARWAAWASAVERGYDARQSYDWALHPATRVPIEAIRADLASREGSR